MNDKQEFAMNIRERDIEDAFIQQEDAAVECELVESDEIKLDFRPEVAARDKLIGLGYDYSDGEWLTGSDEWVNGDPCCYHNKQLQEGGNVIYVSKHPTHSDYSVVFASEEGIPFFTVPTAMLSKPLTPEQLEAKARLEAAYDIYLAFWSVSKMTIAYESFDEFTSGSNSDLKHFLAVVDRTGYRK